VEELCAYFYAAKEDFSHPFTCLGQNNLSDSVFVKTTPLARGKYTIELRRILNVINSAHQIKVPICRKSRDYSLVQAHLSAQIDHNAASRQIKLDRQSDIKLQL
jgi:hypothetical protein